MSTSYLSLSDPNYSVIEADVLKTYKNACIVWVEEVKNPDLEHNYVLYKAQFDEPNEKKLFHGTSEQISRIIIREGFDSTKNKCSAHGLGTYFSTRAAYSRMYAKTRSKDQLAFMFICDVVTGRTCQGRGGQPIPSGFDSCTDNVKKPDMYVVGHNAAAVPRYLVAFYPSAK
jgi:hypothetical protein